jgi:predicted transcriptional regulator
MSARTDATFNQFFEDNGLEGREIAFVQIASGFDPKPITLELFFRRGPYGSIRVIQQAMEQAVAHGWFKAVDEDQYKLTDKGKKVSKSFWDLFYQVYRDFESIPDADMARMVELLRKVADEVQALPEPAEKWGFSMGRKLDQGPSAPLAIQLRRHIIDLLSFREDAHLASWQPYQVSGQLWEVLTYVWRNEANTAAELVEKLQGRGYDEESYTAALQDLVSRGWIAQENGKYVATKEGSALRQQAEDATDRYFDAPWVALGQAGMEEAKSLMEKLAQAIEPPEEQESA